MTNNDQALKMFIKAATKIGCSDVTNMQRCFDHASRMVEVCSFMDATTQLRVMTVLEVSAKLK